MNQKEMLNNFISARLPDIEKSENLMDSMIALHAVIDKQLAFYADMEALFVKHDTGDLFIACPGCASPTLLEFKNCSLCGTVLMEDNENSAVLAKPAPKKEKVKKEEVKEPAKEKVDTEKDKKQKAAKAKELKQKAAKEKAEALKQKKEKTKKVEPKKEVAKEVVDEAAGFDEDDFPTEDEITAMDTRKLKKVIKDFKLEVNPKGVVVADLRDLVNKAIDDLCDDEGEEVDEDNFDEAEVPNGDDGFDESEVEVGEEVAETPEAEVEPTEEDLNNFDLDGMDFDDIDDIEDLDS